MGTHIENDDRNLRRAGEKQLGRNAKAHAARENITLRALIERGLRLAILADRYPKQFELRDASVGGRGMQSPYREGDWACIREAVYEDRES